jgi:sec-independent protein translocase protein TatA
MGGLSPIHWVIIAIAALLLFGGRGKISNIMGDAAKGIKAFRDGLKDGHETITPTLQATSRPSDEAEDPRVH